MRRRSPLARIELNPKVMFGKPVVRGTRITVEKILRSLAAGRTPEAILKSHPRLQRVDIDAAVAYAADAVNGIETIDLPASRR